MSACSSFDAGYEYFTISAMDNAGNMSEVYKTKNPYYKDPADESDDNPAKQLPVSAEATKPGNATAAVTEHTKTDGEGNTVSENSIAEQKKQALPRLMLRRRRKKQQGQSGEQPVRKGKEFYTIQTANDKVFYLIIDRDGEEELVYFLTEITENDLLNATSDNSDTLPKNSVALESAIPVTEGALPNNNTKQDAEQEEKYGKCRGYRGKCGRYGKHGRNHRAGTGEPCGILYPDGRSCRCVHRCSLLFQGSP